MKIFIIGGGIIGLCSAHYLQQSGHEVVVADKTRMLDGCSYGNAGMIVPSHFVPLAAPGMIRKGIRWMFNPESPFYIKPRLNMDLLKWGLKFYQSANERHVQNAAESLRDLNILSKKLFKEFSEKAGFEFAFEEKGLLILYKDEHVGAEEKAVAKMANSIGVEAQILNKEQVQKIEPEMNPDVLGGIYYPGDAHLHPGLFMDALKRNLLKNGATFLEETSVNDIIVANNVVKTVETTKGKYKADQVIVTSGSWTGQLLKKCGINLPLQAGKGYSITLKTPTKLPRIPTILAEAKVAVTPMNGQLRFAGTMEIAGLDLSINKSRVNGILKAIPKYYPGVEVSFPPEQEIWSGLRPCTPDGLPYIGKWPAINNLVIATGHAMMGLSLGPATGKLVAEIVDGRTCSVNEKMFVPERFL